MTDRQKESIKQMRNDGFGYTTISRELNISLNTVKSFCKANNLAGYRAKKKNILANEKFNYCLNCGVTLIQTKGKKQKKFCCDKCRYQWWNRPINKNNNSRNNFKEYICPTCNTKFKVYGNTTRKYCSHACYIKARFERRRNE